MILLEFLGFVLSYHRPHPCFDLRRGTWLEDLGSRWLAGQPIDPTTFSTLVNAARRGFEAIGLQRVSREIVPTVDRYVASLVGEGKAGPP